MADPSEFTTAALQLERASTAGLARSTARARCATQAGSSGVLVQQGWRSPEGAAVAGALLEWRGVGHAPDRVVTDAYEAMHHLAIVARRTASALAEVDQHERSLVVDLLGRFDETRERIRLNTLDFIGLVSDDEAQRQRDAMDAANRAREQASAARAAALRTWYEALDAAARFISRATAELRANTLPVPMALTPTAAPSTPADRIPPMPVPPPADDADKPDDWATEPAWPQLPRYEQVMKGAIYADAMGLNTAAAHLRHFLSNSGTPLTFDVDKLRADVVYSRVEQDGDALVGGQQAAERARAEGILGVPVPFTTPWRAAKLTKDDSLDWYLGLANHHFAVSGVVVVDPADPDRFTVHYRVHVKDRYNWDENKKYGNIGPVEFTDDSLLALHKAGLAREFDLLGTSSVLSITERFSDRSFGPDPGIDEHPGSRTDPRRVVPTTKPS